MNLNEYQEWTGTTAVYPPAFAGIYSSLGLVNEAGEVAGLVKKMVRGDYKETRFEDFQEKLKKELGDVLWYLARTADDYGLKMQDIMDANILKLEDRKQRDVIKGSGDNR